MVPPHRVAYTSETVQLIALCRHPVQRLHMPQARDVLEGGVGVWNSKVCVPKTAPPKKIPLVNVIFPEIWVQGGGVPGGGGGGNSFRLRLPQAVCFFFVAVKDPTCLAFQKLVLGIVESRWYDGNPPPGHLLHASVVVVCQAYAPRWWLTDHSRRSTQQCTRCVWGGGGLQY